MKEILTVIFQSNAMTYGTTQIEMKMLWLLSRGTKGGRTEEISTETHGLTGSRINSLTGPALNTIGRHVPNVLVFNFLPPKNQFFKGFYSQKSTFSKKDASPGYRVKAF